MSRVYVGNLDPRVSERELKDGFRVYGVLKSVWVARRPPGFAFVEFDDLRGALDAIKALDGKNGWRVKLSHNSKDGGGGGRGGDRDRGGRGRGGGDSLKCYECGEPGHFARECRSRVGGPRGGAGGRRRSPSPRRRRSPSYGRRGETEISDEETYDGFDCCWVKLVHPTDDYRSILNRLRLCNEHDNMLRIYGTRFVGTDIHIATERCWMSLDRYLQLLFNNNTNATYKQLEDLRKFLRGAVRGIIHLHNNDIVHDSIRPHNILIKANAKPLVPKLGGISQCKIHTDEWSFTRDLYDMGRTILTCETNGKHKIHDDDVKNEEDYRNEARFKEDMDALLETNPLAHDLVTRLFAYKQHPISAKDVYNHYYFWEDGTYLEFMQHVSNAIDGKDGDKTLLSELRKCKSDVFGSYWKVDEPWNTKLRADTDYNDTRIDELLRLIRNASYHLNREDRIDFEKYILRKFPRLFYSVFDAVKKSKNKFFNDFFTK